MAEWADKVREHPVRAQLEDLRGCLDRADLDLDEAGREQFEHARSVVAHAREVVEAAEPPLVSPQMLDAVQTAATNTAAGNQSGSHRKAERDARHKQLQLAALEPFLEPLEADQQAAIRAQFAEHLFGPAPAPAGGETEHAINTAELARLMATALAEQVKK